MPLRAWSDDNSLAGLSASAPVTGCELSAITASNIAHALLIAERQMATPRRAQVIEDVVSH